MSPSFNFLHIAHNNVELFFGQVSGFSTNLRELEIENTHFLGKSRNSYALVQGFSGCVGLPDILGKYNQSNRKPLRLFYFIFCSWVYSFVMSVLERKTSQFLRTTPCRQCDIDFPLANTAQHHETSGRLPLAALGLVRTTLKCQHLGHFPLQCVVHVFSIWGDNIFNIAHVSNTI